MRREMADAFALRHQVVPKSVHPFGAGRARGHADDGDAASSPRHRRALCLPLLLALQHGGDAAEGGAVVHIGHAELMDAEFFEPRHEAQHEERTRPEVEQVLVVADPRQTQQLLPQRAGQRGRAVGRFHGLDLGQRQVAPIDLAARGGGQTIEQFVAHRHHVLRQALSQQRAHRGGDRGQLGGRVAQDQIGDELFADAG